MASFASGVGLIPEQDWELPDLAASPFGTDPTAASIGFVNGEAGRLGRRRSRGRRRVRAARSRTSPRTSWSTSPPPPWPATSPTPRARPRSTVTAPADLSSISGSPVTVTRHDGARQHGRRRWPPTPTTTRSTTSASTTAAGRRLLHGRRAGDRRDDGAERGRHRGRRRDRARHPHRRVRLRARHVAVRHHRPRATTTTGRATTPTRRRRTSTPGRSTCSGSRSTTTAPNVIFRVQTRDLSPTFGSPLGAQLVDVYVHDPAAPPGSTSTAASFPQRNYRSPPASAWSRLIEVQGFGQRYVDAQQRHLRHGPDQREPDLPVHHLQRPEGDASARRRRAGPSPSC